MHKFLLFLSLPFVSLYALTPAEIFPDALSSSSEINARQNTSVTGSGAELTTPILLTDRVELLCDGRPCSSTRSAPASLPAFAFQESNATTVVELTQNVTLSQSDIGHLLIKADGLTVTFDAPPPAKGFNPLQKIASITDNRRNTTYIFKAGDYHIGSFEVLNTINGSDTDTLSISPQGNASLYIRDRFKFVKKEDAARNRKSVEINTQQSPKSLFINALGPVEISTDSDFSVNAFIYSHDAVTLQSLSTSSFNGALHAEGKLITGPSSSAAPLNLAYDAAGVNELYVFGPTLQSLPDEPDPEVNNATLLGVDSNGNGVRDDVERLIINEEIKNIEFPKTHTAISLQYAWAWQKMIESPVLETREFLEKASACKWYWFNKETKDIRGFLNRQKWRKSHPNKLGSKLQDQIFNTKERVEQRFKFNQASSGNIFDLADQSIDACLINIDKLGE